MKELNEEHAKKLLKKAKKVVKNDNALTKLERKFAKEIIRLNDEQIDAGALYNLIDYTEGWLRKHERLFTTGHLQKVIDTIKEGNRVLFARTGEMI